MHKRLLHIGVLGFVVSTIACSLSAAAAPAQSPTQIALTPDATPSLISVASSPASVTQAPSTVPPTTIPTVAATNCSSSPKSQLAIGMTARVSPGTSSNVRSQPSKASALVTTIPGGLQVTVLGGPVCADGYQWWQVKSEQTQGWTVEGSGSSYWLVPVISVPVNILIGTAPQTVNYGNVSFTLSSALTDHVQARTFFAAPHDPNIPIFLNTSQRLEFTLNGFEYTASNRPMLMIVYKISDLEGSAPNYTSMVDAMRTLITQLTPIAIGVSLASQINIIPAQNAGQAFHAQGRFFRFQNGKGVRFITYYTQHPGPVDNYSLFYVYQGISDKDLYYMAALIPITTLKIGLLPPFQNPPDANANNAYLTQVAQKVDSFSAKDFTPALDDLDAWIGSVQIK